MPFQGKKLSDCGLSQRHSRQPQMSVETGSLGIVLYSIGVQPPKIIAARPMNPRPAVMSRSNDPVDPIVK